MKSPLPSTLHSRSAAERDRASATDMVSVPRTLAPKMSWGQ
jgi:hypothetical protein